ncbi:MAG TPA: transposase [Gemmata sp.]
MAHAAYKFRLYPNATQERALASHLETLRQVYNAALAYRIDYYTETGKSLKQGELYKLFASLRNLQLEDQKAGGAGPHWLTHVSAVSVRDTCARVEVAFDNFFRRLKQKAGKAGFPRFKGYGRLRSIPFENTYPAGCVLRTAKGELAGTAIKNKSGRGCRDVPAARKGYRLDVFGTGRIKVIAHRDIVGVVKTACVERDVDGKWYVVLVSQYEAEPAPESTKPPVGIDVGLESFLTRSDGVQRPNPKHLKSKLKVLRRVQRAASRKIEAAKKRKQKFRECKNLKKAFHKVAKLHVRVRNLRKEHHHKEANALVNEFGTICAEKLNIRGMVKNGKLARTISDAAWGGFLIVLKHKAAKAGVRFVEVDAKRTSQTCPQCGAVAKKKLSQRRHKCSCGLDIHRDHAAALVVLQRGTGSTGGGPLPAVGGSPPNPVGMPSGRERSGGGRGRQRKTNAKSTVPKVPKANRSRKVSQTPTIPGME